MISRAILTAVFGGERNAGWRRARREKLLTKLLTNRRQLQRLLSRLRHLARKAMETPSNLPAVKMLDVVMIPPVPGTMRNRLRLDPTVKPIKTSISYQSCAVQNGWKRRRSLHTSAADDGWTKCGFCTTGTPLLNGATVLVYSRFEASMLFPRSCAPLVAPASLNLCPLCLSKQQVAEAVKATAATESAVADQLHQKELECEERLYEMEQLVRHF